MPTTRVAPRDAGGPAARAGRDVEQEIELGLEDVYNGTMRRFAMTQDGQTRTVDVRIPAGVGDGSRVRVAGEGEQGSGGAKAGDLYLRIRLAPHPTFERKGKDLYTHVKVPLTTAVLGGETEVKTLGGQIVAAQDSAHDAERSGVPAERPRDADRRQTGPGPWRSLRDGRRPAAREQLTPEQREHAFARPTEQETAPKADRRKLIAP